ncbi:MAG: hypothetical protein JO186_12320 [Actinobacteria bacterium]|nr:hypothetical protein [Actinomycetota bacterium]MBV8395934.1 hypothetical protein [Actinomycetota bacterium]
MRHPGELLRRRRIRIALWIAVIEGLLTVVHALPHIVLYVLAVVAIAFYVTAGRHYKSTFGRQLAWIFAASQALAVLVPIVWFAAKWAAILAIALIAVAALVFLFMERDHAPQE